MLESEPEGRVVPLAEGRTLRAIGSTPVHPVLAGATAGGGVVMVVVGAALGSNCTGALPLVEGEFVAGGADGGGGKEG
jgi:hypothetical protein